MRVSKTFKGVRETNRGKIDVGGVTDAAAEPKPPGRKKVDRTNRIEAQRKNLRRREPAAFRVRAPIEGETTDGVRDRGIARERPPGRVRNEDPRAQGTAEMDARAGNRTIRKAHSVLHRICRPMRAPV